MLNTHLCNAPTSSKKVFQTSRREEQRVSNVERLSATFWLSFKYSTFSGTLSPSLTFLIFFPSIPPPPRSDNIITMFVFILKCERVLLPVCVRHTLLIFNYYKRLSLIVTFFHLANYIHKSVHRHSIYCIKSLYVIKQMYNTNVI